MGVLFAFIALFCWGFGDFLIQKSARQLGNWHTLFFDNVWIIFVLFPFVYHDVGALFADGGIFFIVAGTITLLACLLDFEALRRGKISVVEPIYALEILVTVFISAILIDERLSSMQIFFIVILVFGIILISVRSFSDFKKIKIEKGVWHAFFAAVAMGMVNYIFGFGARIVSPLAVNWTVSFFLLLTALIYFVGKNKLPEIARAWKQKKSLVLGFSFFNNMAWIAYAYSMLYIPIGIATSISESYIALAATLGILFNKEKLRPRQVVGIGIVIISVIVLALISE